jgi:CRP/FNR family transcriptional regulator
MNTADKIRFSEAFPMVETMTPAEKTALYSRLIVRQFSAGSPILFEGDDCTHIPLVISGVIKVYKIHENGREILLYTIAAGESCILTATCILNREAFPALAEAEENLTVGLLPAEYFQHLIDSDAHWRSYLFSLYSSRLISVIRHLENISFYSVQSRIEKILREKEKSPGSPIFITHQEIASVIGTSREVVTRILKTM